MPHQNGAGKWGNNRDRDGNTRGGNKGYKPGQNKDRTGN